MLNSRQKDGSKGIPSTIYIANKKKMSSFKSQMRSYFEPKEHRQEALLLQAMPLVSEFVTDPAVAVQAIWRPVFEDDLRKGVLSRGC